MLRCFLLWFLICQGSSIGTLWVCTLHSPKSHIKGSPVYVRPQVLKFINDILQRIVPFWITPPYASLHHSTAVSIIMAFYYVVSGHRIVKINTLGQLVALLVDLHRLNGAIPQDLEYAPFLRVTSVTMIRAAYHLAYDMLIQLGESTRGFRWVIHEKESIVLFSSYILLYDHCFTALYPLVYNALHNCPGKRLYCLKYFSN